MRTLEICRKCKQFKNDMFTVNGTVHEKVFCTVPGNVLWHTCEYYAKKEIPDACEYRFDQIVMEQKWLDEEWMKDKLK